MVSEPSKPSNQQQQQPVSAIIGSLPPLVCLLFLFLQSIYSIYRCIKTRRYVREVDANLKHTHQTTYVKMMFTRLPGVKPPGDEGWRFWRYKRYPGFKYPTRVLSVVVVVIVVNVSIFFACVIDIGVVQRFLTGLKIEMLSRSVKVSGNIALTLATALSTLHLILFLQVYRSHCLQLYRGDRSFMVTPQRSSHQTVNHALRFPGYYIAYNSWGFILVFGIVWILGFVDGCVMELLGQDNRIGEFVLKAFELLTYPVMGVALFYLQLLIARQLLLQEKLKPSDQDKPLAVDNRNFFDVVSYYFLFVNVAVGLLSCLLRTASSFILSVFLVARLDRNLLMTGWHDEDKGYTAYIGMLLVDCTHNHPVLRVFCTTLWEAVETRRRAGTTPQGFSLQGMDGGIGQQNNRHQRYVVTEGTMSRSRKRWQLAFTLLRNPSLTLDRRQNTFTEKAEPVADELELETKCMNEATKFGMQMISTSPILAMYILLGIPVIYVSSVFSKSNTG